MRLAVYIAIEHEEREGVMIILKGPTACASYPFLVCMAKVKSMLSKCSFSKVTE